MTKKNKLLFEVSWEVCNKVGGINTVLRSKAAQAVADFGDNYITIGPLLSCNPEFIPEEDERFAPALELLRERNIIASMGRWDIDGKPRCLLVDFKNAFPKQNVLLFDLWEEYGVDSMSGGWDYIEPVLFSTACGMAIEELSRDLIESHETYAVFHEWMSGGGLLYVKTHLPEINTIFVTHATILGRALSGGGVDIYHHPEEIALLQEAKKYNITAKYSIETVCAREADCFTTVSDITAREATILLGRAPDLITPNGFNVECVPDYSTIRGGYYEAREKLLDFSSHFLKKTFDPSKSKILSLSGRYEFHNKGIDILLESLSRINADLKEQNSDLNVITFLLVIAGNVGVCDETVSRLRDPLVKLEKFSGISTHHLGDSHHDPIITYCQKYNLLNSADDTCNIILIPVYLDGNDGAINMPYYEILGGCDLSIYPSYYEPWGYTPLESVAYSVPTVTTDKAGFGQWVENNFPPERAGIRILERLTNDDASVTDSLTKELNKFLLWDDEELWLQKHGARVIAEKASWTEFYHFYQEAYNVAHKSKKIRMAGLTEEKKAHSVLFPGKNSKYPHFIPFSVVSSLPEPLKSLKELSYNLCWSWNSAAKRLFAQLDPILWEKIYHNPVALWERLDQKNINEHVVDTAYMALYAHVIKEYERYLAAPAAFKTIAHTIREEAPVAYFSMEFGIHESLPIYSGGLGILSGDHLKSASDLSLPIVGISLLYKYGYFNQLINKQGEQVVEYRENNFAHMPIEVVQNSQKRPLIIPIEFPGRTVYIQIWKAHVGKALLYFLDANIEKNASIDRHITDRLYDGDTRERIEQEIILGIGGERLLHKLKIEPSLYHLNEGHSAFLLIERINTLMYEKNLDFATACEVVKGSTVFTTHTPVAAGNEHFDKALVENFFSDYIKGMGISWEQFWNLGHLNPGDDSPFAMTLMALKLSYKRNGVSRLHGMVSRKMWGKIWEGFALEEIPISHITNGVHLPSWQAEEITALSSTGVNAHKENNILHNIDTIPDALLWETHTTLKKKLFSLINDVVMKNWMREGEDPALCKIFHSQLNPKALTIGFARRFAPYKRPTLILKDLERLKEIVSNELFPVQFIFAGKAHPADTLGHQLIKEIVAISKEKEFVGKVIFLEDYDISMARTLVAGVDVWLNTPIRPYEASGTSGMKAALNGVLNCSILDGWWDEAYDKTNGWAIGQGETYENPNTQNNVDACNLYSLIEHTIAPLFYRYTPQGIPEEWIAMMKSSMKSITKTFTTDRMLQDYISMMYEPTAERNKILTEDNYHHARDLAEWKRTLPSRFATLRIHDVVVEDGMGNELHVGDALSVKVTIDKGSILSKEILAEIVMENIIEDGDEKTFAAEKLSLSEERETTVTYEGTITTKDCGQFHYGIRVIPIHPVLGTKYETGLVVWN